MTKLIVEYPNKKTKTLRGRKAAEYMRKLGLTTMDLCMLLMGMPLVDKLGNTIKLKY